MTPKEKAKDLVSKFIHLTKQITGANGTIYNSKQCALIAVDEILEEISEVLMVTASSYVVEHIVFWQEVKQEIEKL